MLNEDCSLTAIERRAISGLAGIFAVRLLGLFLILPVFALYARDLEGHTPFLIGFALGVYGLTQALLQIPLGMASDRIGRKPVIVAGLLVFAAGSVIAALADSIYAVIVGRALQGAGAVSAAIMALIADLTREESRTKAMALIGITVGASFVLSLVLGPALNGIIGVPGIFWLTAALGAMGIAVLVFWVPTPTHGHVRGLALRSALGLRRVLISSRLLRLDLGILILHAALTAIFVVVPLALVQHGRLVVDEHWKIYVPVMLCSAALLFPAITVADKKPRTIFAAMILVIVVSQLALFAGYQTVAGLVAGLLLFFIGFNVLEATLPAMISKAAPTDSKGAAIGIYSTFQFLGAFLGGAIGGWLHGAYGVSTVFVFTASLLMLWFVVALTAPALAQYTTRILHIGRRAPADVRTLAEQLAAIPGVAEATVIAEEGVAYLKVDDGALDLKALEKFTASA